MGKPAVAITSSAAERREAQASAERLRRQMGEEEWPRTIARQSLNKYGDTPTLIFGSGSTFVMYDNDEYVWRSRIISPPSR
jgi:hypothetical protein